MSDIKNYFSQAEEIERLKKIIAGFEAATTKKVDEANKRINNANAQARYWRDKHDHLKDKLKRLYDE